MAIISRELEEKAAKVLITLSVVIALGVLVAILFHIMQKGLGVISLDFLFKYPEDMGRMGGIFPSIVGTFYLVLVALGVATPLGVFSAVQLTEYAKKGKLVKQIRFATETLAGIPSIVYGLFGFAFFVIYLQFSWSILSGGLTLAIMILPTIIRTAEEAIKSVPESYREGSLAMGASKWQTIFKIVLPSALPGIVTGIILGIGRAVSETAAVLLTAGSSGLHMPTSVTDPARTLAVHLYVLVSEGISFEMGYGTATVLIIAIFFINSIANLLMYKMTSRV
ncbi:MAG TPA: phosphate ABC transporter permease PtsA [Desulfotomaculum sp.]|nr:MAG: phosphate ABC transporter permease [Desulfotomaculum sp. BICA1-6]HBX23272.1 phosphate ABC transporter permease PtsA [Desulfotomaculum sp.]